MSAPSPAPAAAPVPGWATTHLRPGESARWWGRPSMAGAVPVLASAVAAVAALAVGYAYGLDQPGLLLTGVPALVVALGGILVQGARRIVRLRSTSYVVTAERLYVIESRVTTDVKVIPLGRVSHVALQQGWIGRTLGYWRVQVSAHGGGEASRVLIPALPDAPGLLQELSDGMARGADASWLLRGD